MDQRDELVKLADESRIRVSEFTGNVLYLRCTEDKLDQVKQFGGTLKVKTIDGVCRGPWIFPSKKAAQLALRTCQSSCDSDELAVEAYSPSAEETSFTKLRVSGIPASGSIADVAKLTPKATSITIRLATDNLSTDTGSKVAVVSFKCQDDCVATFAANGNAVIQGQAVCLSFGRKNDNLTNRTTAKRNHTSSNRGNVVQGFGSKGKGRGRKNAKTASAS